MQVQDSNSTPDRISGIAFLLSALPLVLLAIWKLKFDFGIVFFSDSLDYLNLSRHLFGHVSAPWFPFHRTIGYPAVLAIMQFFAGDNFAVATAAMQIIFAAFSGSFLLWVLRREIGAIELLFLGLLLPGLLLKYGYYIMTDGLVISLGTISIAALLLFLRSNPSLYARRYLALFLAVVLFGVFVRPSFAAIGWMGLISISFIAPRQAVGSGCVLVAVLFCGAMIDHVGYGIGVRLHAPAEAAAEAQSRPALYHVFVRDVAARLENGDRALRYDEMQELSRALTTQERTNGKCSILKCVFGSPTAAMVLDDIERHPEFFFMGPVPGSSIGATRLWHMLGPVWSYRYDAPFNAAEVVDSNGQFPAALKFLSDSLSDYIRRNPEVRKTEIVGHALDGCSYGDAGRCILAQKNFATMWFIWSAMESQYGSVGADVVFRTAASAIAKQVSASRHLLLLNQIASGSVGVPWLDYDSGALRVPPETSMSPGNLDWLPSYIDKGTRAKLQGAQIETFSRPSFRLDQQESVFIITFLRPLLTTLAILMFLPSMFLGGTKRRCAIIFTLGTYAGGVSAIAFSQTIYGRYLDHFVIFLLVGAMLQADVLLTFVGERYWPLLERARASSCVFRNWGAKPIAH
ncbi:MULTISPECIES: hypothetical protein [unclassified Bradyrhizobium]|uniref:hypothetical protein n=1 Tax=unclassified Bradyrhizobium TaxID=2631580 RepID=UPI00291624E7|nr:MULTISPECIES: hypothetical protein [unclassified Bradyrhizobium]